MRSLQEINKSWLSREAGITTIFVTHDREEALSLSDRIVVMNDGFIEWNWIFLPTRPRGPYGFYGC